jgi:nucleoside-diphosphate-sugar epimerase
MRVVVTGATGNVGSALLRWLADAPDVDSVVGVARRPPGRGTDPAYDRADWQALDLGAPDAAERLAAIIRGADAVVHLAWRILADHDRAGQVRTNRQGTAAVVRAVREARVPQLVYLSSAAVYSPGPVGVPVAETWPRRGIPGSSYSADKVAVEDMLDRVEAAVPDLRIVRVRPPMVLQPSAAREVTGMALGRFAPLARLTHARLPLLPLPSRTRAQVVAADDVADLVGRAVRHGAAGAYNVADDPVFTPAELARLLGGRHVPVPAAAVRTVLGVTHRLRLQRLSPSWADLLLDTPVLDCTRARTEVGWRPRHDGRTLVIRMRQAVAAGTSAPTPPLG